ncbi:MAG: tRNA pseudouridine(55) synthase TruB [Firmicutes bacterium]|nr:tRNA pseudouridine(55) synthase TruB [Bacillota bacterium]
MDGILVINKPAGYTSHDCIAVLRGITGIRKLGHTGTLDPNATGVLPVCMGKATKLIEYMDAGFKSYRAGIRFGTETDTQDIWGKELERTCGEALPASFEEVAEALGAFLGEQLQTPPAYSAVFVNGRRAYDIARSGGTPELEARKITVSSIDLLSYDTKKGEGVFDISCSRGTYVRTICSDLGKKLGCGACLCSLVRTSACGFTLSEALDLEEARKMPREEVLARVLPIGRAASEMQRLELKEELAKAYMNGMTVKTDSKGYIQGEPVAVFINGELSGISRFERDSLRPIKIFS